MPIAAATGASIWFEDLGDRGQPVILLIHGMSGTNEVWQHQIEPLRDAGFRTIRFDRRGAGRSIADEPPTGSNVGDILTVLDQAHVASAHVIGHALGAADAVELTAHHTDRVSSLVVTNGHGAVADAFPAALRDRLWSRGIWSLRPSERELSPTYRALDEAGTTRWEGIESRAQRHDTVAPQRRAVDLARLGTLDVPALFIAGDADLLTPPFVVRRLAEAVPRSRYVVIAESGHVSPWERPDAWNAVVLDFLAGIDRRDARSDLPGEP